jgi:toluene monooxygenase system protein E
MATRSSRAHRTWSVLGDVRRKPSTYEVTAARFHYHFRREPAPFELDPGMPMNRWYLRYREGSPFQVDDWEGFRDPYKLTYRDYVALQHDRETYLDLLIDTHEAMSSAASLAPGWVATLRTLLIPMRFPLHVLQMTGLYVGQMAPSSFITNAANFGAADEMRRVQRIAYWTKVLANAHGDELATTALARDSWEQDEAWQPLRRTCEQLLVTHDWGEAFAARNLAVKPVLDALLDWQLAELARRNSDQFLALLFTEFQADARRSQDWSAALVKYALDQRPALADVLSGWLGAWQPRVLAAAEALAPAFALAPEPMSAADVMTAVAEHRSFLSPTGL